MKSGFAHAGRRSLSHSSSKTKSGRDASSQGAEKARRRKRNGSRPRKNRAQDRPTIEQIVAALPTRTNWPAKSQTGSFAGVARAPRDGYDAVVSDDRRREDEGSGMTF